MMPNIKSAKKRVRVNEVKAARNKNYRSALKTSLKKANAAIDTASADRQDVVRATIKQLDQSVAKGILHKNTAARRKSVLVRKLNKVQG